MNLKNKKLPFKKTNQIKVEMGFVDGCKIISK